MALDIRCERAQAGDDQNRREDDQQDGEWEMSWLDRMVGWPFGYSMARCAANGLFQGVLATSPVWIWVLFFK